MLGPLTTEYFLTAGAGEASTELNAFDAAESGVGCRKITARRKRGKTDFNLFPNLSGIV